ncbi:glycosyltransferase [Pseudomonas protegens]|uniref:glycosyltransferase n=1 Tax=Pseudomonas protegens TaxID=380021 RepID=UPI002DBF1E15|nr:glycosyltransferase [Pseudomonas protegens]WRV89924.1 glycosyltransferase [Pseudomonas protegens]
MLSATVVVSCYNQERYIVECLDSILSQEINFECEVIVSDDCSTDRTQEVLLEYSRLHEGRLKLNLRSENVGPALNYLGLHSMASGDIVFHFDGDDVMLPGKLALQYKEFQEDAQVNVVFHKAVYFSDDDKYLSDTQFPDSAEKSIDVSGEELARWGSVAVHSSYAYRRSSRKTVINREFMEWFFAMDSLIPEGKAVYINQTLVKYRCNPSAGSYLSTQSGKLKAYSIYFDDIERYFDSYKVLRCDLYANYFVTFLAMLRSTNRFSLKRSLFLLRNIYCLRPKKVLNTLGVRRLVGPKLKNR